MILVMQIVPALLLFLSFTGFATSQPLVVQAPSHRESAALALLIGVIGSAADKELATLARVIERDISFTGQFSAHVKRFNAVPSKHVMKQLFEQGYPLAIFLVRNVQLTQGLISSHEHGCVEWRLYDTGQAVMVDGKQSNRSSEVLRGWGHSLSDAIWLALMGQPGFFSTKLAYSKRVKNRKGAVNKHICVADYDGSHEQVLVSSPTINIAPRWNKDRQNPLLFYSEYTNSNVRLVAVAMNKKRLVAVNSDGVTMVPSFSDRGTAVAYCASLGSGGCQLFFGQNGDYKQVTHNSGNNMAPSLSDDGRIIYFCSNYQTGAPAIYRYDTSADTTERITTGGYCVGPAYHEKKGLVAYSKIVKGTLQVFTYDVHAKRHTQLTTGQGNKEDCFWSPCGTYLLCSYQNKDEGRIALINTITKEQKYLTDQHSHCSYPTWSTSFAQFPVVRS